MPEENETLRLGPDDLTALRRQIGSGAVKLTRYEPCLCGKLLDATTHTRKWHSGRWEGGKQISPGVNYTTVMCADCSKEFDEWPRIVCVGCKTLMGFIKWGRQSTGFVFEKGRHYHIADCPKCNPKRQSTPVLEHDHFCRQNRVNTVTPLDLLQEIEEKTLQGKRDAAKLKESLKGPQP